MSMDVISLRIAKHVGTEAPNFGPVEVKDGGAQVDFHSVGPNETIRARQVDKKLSRAHSSVLLLNNSKSGKELNSEEGTDSNDHEIHQ